MEKDMDGGHAGKHGGTYVTDKNNFALTKIE